MYVDWHVPLLIFHNLVTDCDDLACIVALIEENLVLTSKGELHFYDYSFAINIRGTFLAGTSCLWTSKNV